MQAQQLIVQALYSRFKAQRDEAMAGLAIIVNSSVGIGDHLTHVQEGEELIKKITEADECIRTLDSMIPEQNPQE